MRSSSCLLVLCTNIDLDSGVVFSVFDSVDPGDNLFVYFVCLICWLAPCGQSVFDWFLTSETLASFICWLKGEPPPGPLRTQTAPSKKDSDAVLFRVFCTSDLKALWDVVVNFYLKMSTGSGWKFNDSFSEILARKGEPLLLTNLFIFGMNGSTTSQSCDGEQ